VLLVLCYWCCATGAVLQVQAYPNTQTAEIA